MKTHLSLLIFFWVVACVRGREVVVLGLSQPEEHAPSYVVEAGGTVTIDVVVPASIKPAALTYELWQVAGAVGVPLGKHEALASAVDAHGLMPVRVVFPKVKRLTQVWVKFFETTASTESSAEVGRAQVWVYPPVNWTPIAKRLKGDESRLVVFGESAELREFLTLRGITFTDEGENTPEKPAPGTLAVGALSTKAWGAFKNRLVPAGWRLVVFVNDGPEMPGVYTTATDSGAITRVTLPVLERLASDPRAQTLLLQLIEQHLKAAPAALF